MDSKLNNLVKLITQSSEFRSLKDVVENNPYHDNEDVYAHSLKTYQIAMEVSSGKFIDNENAKKSFENFLNENVHGLTRRELLILVALLHDFGKSLSFENGGQKESILSTKPNGDTQCSGHEYWGSVFIKEFLKQFELNTKAIDYISNLIRLHDSFNDGYFKAKVDWPIEIVVKDIKARADNFYIEALFNIYCDNFNAAPFDFAQKIVEQVFNTPLFYSERKYFGVNTN